MAADRGTSLVVAAIVLLMSILPSRAACVPVSFEDYAFKAGEKLNFVVNYKFGIINCDVGMAKVTLDTVCVCDTEAFHCHVYGRTIKRFEKLFNVTEDFNSWFAVNGLRPIRFARDTYENGYIARNEYSYLWNEAKPVIDASVYTSHMGDKHLELPLDDCTFDLPGLFFFARNIDMSKVEKDVKYPMTFAIDDEVFNVYFIYRGIEVKKVQGLGKVRCMKFSAKLLEGNVFKGNDDMTIYISDDLNRLPVEFSAPLIVGKASGRLVSWSGLKHPFDSLVQ